MPAKEEQDRETKTCVRHNHTMKILFGTAICAVCTFEKSKIFCTLCGKKTLGNILGPYCEKCTLLCLKKCRNCTLQKNPNYCIKCVHYTSAKQRKSTMKKMEIHVTYKIQ